MHQVLDFHTTSLRKMVIQKMKFLFSFVTDDKKLLGDICNSLELRNYPLKLFVKNIEFHTAIQLN